MVKKHMRYEFPFLGKNEIITREFLTAEDPYQASTVEKLRTRWLDESKILFGSFTPSGP